MNRREFVKMSPAFAGAAVSASIVVREEGKPDHEFGVSVLRTQPGDTLVLQCQGHISSETAARCGQVFKQLMPGLKVLVLDESVTLAGVLRGA